MNRNKKFSSFLLFLIISLLCFSWLDGAPEGQEPRKPRLALSLSSGLAMMAGGDLKLMGKEAEALRSDPSLAEFDVSVVWKNLERLPHFQFEISYYLTRTLTVGLGLETRHRRQTVHKPFMGGLISYYGEGILSDDGEYLITNEYEMLYGFTPVFIRDTALFLQICYFKPLEKNIQLYLGGGPAVHFGRMDLDYQSYKDETIYSYYRQPTVNPGEYTLILEGTEQVVTWDYRFHMVRRTFLGLTGAAGIEFQMSSHHALFLESDFRLAISKKWKGEMVRISGVNNETLLEQVVSGTCAYCPWQYVGIVPVNYFGLAVDPGEAGRRASYNLGGVTFKVGYRLKF
ncbi:MAG: hypothetical protein N3G18_06510 [Candidatus Saccharicenans sp.]|nr:hypothetical protein [Candidatus Saccharicenans sp.]